MNNNTLKRKRKTRNKFVRRRSMKKKKSNKGGMRRNLRSLTENLESLTTISDDIHNVKLLNKRLKEAFETIREQEQEIANLKFQLESLPEATAFHEIALGQPISQGAASVESQEESRGPRQTRPYRPGPTLWGRHPIRGRGNR
jgi:hypothetical protein